MKTTTKNTNREPVTIKFNNIKNYFMNLNTLILSFLGIVT